MSLINKSWAKLWKAIFVLLLRSALEDRLFVEGFPAF